MLTLLLLFHTLLVSPGEEGTFVGVRAALSSRVGGEVYKVIVNSSSPSSTSPSPLWCSQLLTTLALHNGDMLTLLVVIKCLLLLVLSVVLFIIWSPIILYFTEHKPHLCICRTMV